MKPLTLEILMEQGRLARLLGIPKKQPPTNSWWRKPSGPRQLQFNFDRPATQVRTNSSNPPSQDYRAQTPGRIPSKVQSNPVVSKPSTPTTPNLNSRMARSKARMNRSPTTSRARTPMPTRKKGNPNDFGYGVFDDNES